MNDTGPATATDLHFLTIAQAARLIETRKLSPVELTQALLERIDAIDPENLRTYRDADFSFAFSYPASWSEQPGMGPRHARRNHGAQ